jgi:hypothetical protein
VNFVVGVRGGVLRTNGIGMQLHLFLMVVPRHPFGRERRF